jgi:CRP-like cAMP-binding protein
MSIAKMLKGHELFGSLSFEEVEAISGFAGLKEYEKGETIFRSGVPATHFFVLQKGRVDLRLPAEAHEASLAVGHINEGDVFGLSPLLGSGRSTTTAQCTEASTVLAIEAQPLRAVLEANSLVGLRIMSALAEAYFTRYVETLKRLQNVVNEVAAI